MFKKHRGARKNALKMEYRGYHSNEIEALSQNISEANLCWLA